MRRISCLCIEYVYIHYVNQTNDTRRWRLDCVCVLIGSVGWLGGWIDWVCGLMGGWIDGWVAWWVGEVMGRWVGDCDGLGDWVWVDGWGVDWMGRMNVFKTSGHLQNLMAARVPVHHAWNNFWVFQKVWWGYNNLFKCSRASEIVHVSRPIIICRVTTKQIIKEITCRVTKPKSGYFALEMQTYNTVYTPSHVFLKLSGTSKMCSDQLQLQSGFQTYVWQTCRREHQAGAVCSQRVWRIGKQGNSHSKQYYETPNNGSSCNNHNKYNNVKWHIFPKLIYL